MTVNEKERLAKVEVKMEALKEEMEELGGEYKTLSSDVREVLKYIKGDELTGYKGDLCQGLEFENRLKTMEDMADNIVRVLTYSKRTFIFLVLLFGGLMTIIKFWDWLISLAIKLKS
jgi:hypothetical protein